MACRPGPGFGSGLKNQEEKTQPLVHQNCTRFLDLFDKTCSVSNLIVGGGRRKVISAANIFYFLFLLASNVLTIMFENTFCTTEERRF